VRDRILSMLSLLEYNIHKVASQYLIYNLIGKYRLNQNTLNAQCNNNCITGIINHVHR
jgi:hypothetical protein